MNILESSWFKLLYLKDKKGIIFVVFTMILLSVVLGYYTPIVMNDLYVSIESKKDFYQNLYFLGFILIAEYIVYVTYAICIAKYIEHLLLHIRSFTFSNWLNTQEVTFSKKDLSKEYPMGEIISRILTDTGAVVELVSSGSFKIFIDFAYIISCLVSFIRLNTTSGIALILAEVLVCAFLIWSSKKMASIYLDVRKATGIMSRMLANVSAGLRFSFYTPNGNYASKKSLKSFDDFLKKQLTANIWDAGFFAVAESLFPILLALLVFVFPYSNIVEVAIIAAIIDLVQRSISPIKQVAQKISGIQRARAGIIRIDEFNKELETFPKTSDREFEKIDLDKFNLDVPSFKYHGSDFEIKNVKFEISKGGLFGIVGMSGCGKSTILKIIAGHIIPDDFNISLVSENRTITHNKLDTLEEYKSQVSIISQDSHVFSQSLGFNISLDSNEDENKLKEFWNKVLENIPYLKTWNVDLQTAIDPKDLSLGQKQLISALRSCYQSRPIVLFDEISSGLDSELEEALRQLVLMIQKHSITIVVAHRIETITGANNIFVMNNGAIVDEGTHVELLESSAVYQEFIAQLNKSLIKN
ncbi:MAG: ABC transporter ATP-binding protein/permease [Bacteriovoracaceae bacterium]|jgi:ATP-binding cassette subfamily B protein|nr:ABC transporter ATP-binding protein/permease [Bacteriovoracaceae bacterium]